MADEIEQATPPVAGRQDKQVPKRAPLPANLPQREIRHEPESTTCQTPGCGCQMKRIGEDVTEKLDYVPGVFTVERDIRGKWACGEELFLGRQLGAEAVRKRAVLLITSEVDLSDRARIDDRRGRKGLSTPESMLITSFHTISAHS